MTTDTAILNRLEGATRRFRHSGVQLTHEERARTFYWCRDRALDAMLIAASMRKSGFMIDAEVSQAMAYLRVACDVFPLGGHGDSISIEDILDGREPDASPVRGAGGSSG